MSVQTITADMLMALLEQAGEKDEYQALYDALMAQTTTAKLESFGFFLQDYVIEGGVVTVDNANPKQFTVSEMIISFADGLYKVAGKKIQVSAVSATLYLDFTVNNGFVLGKVHPSGDYYPLWTLTTSASGDIVSAVDVRGAMGFIRFREDIQGIITDNLVVDEARITPGAVGTTRIADLAVTTPKYADGSVTSAKLAEEVIERFETAEDRLDDQQALISAIQSGDSGAAADAARYNSVTGITYDNLKKRLDVEYQEASARLGDNTNKINELLANSAIVGALTPTELPLFNNIAIQTDVSINTQAYSTAVLEVSHIEDGLIEVYGKIGVDTLVPLTLVSQSGSEQSSASNIGLFYIDNLGYADLLFRYKPSVTNFRFCTAKVLLSFNQNSFKKIERPKQTPSVGTPVINSSYEPVGFIKNNVIYGNRETMLRRSTDYGKNWSLVHDFVTSKPYITLISDTGRFIIVLENGELWTSDLTGANFTLRHTFEGGKPDGAFGFSMYKNMIFFAEYNPVKTPPTAKRVIASFDGGASWATILNIMDSPNNFHTHGVQYDPYEDIIWVVTGDGVQAKMIFYSVDRGLTWDKVAPWGLAPIQACTVIPLPECVLFIGDSYQVGVHRYVRPKMGTVKGQNFIFERAMLLQNDWNNTKEVPIPSKPVIDFENNKAYFGWYLSNNAVGGGYVLHHANVFATADGFNFTQIFSTSKPADGVGIGKGVGLTNEKYPAFFLSDLNQGTYRNNTLVIPVTWP